MTKRRKARKGAPQAKAKGATREKGRQKVVEMAPDKLSDRALELKPMSRVTHGKGKRVY